MRRFVITLSTFGLLGAFIGCHHTAGVCDCDEHARPAHGTIITPSTKPEVLKEMPKGKEKEPKEEEQATNGPVTDTPAKDSQDQ